MAETVPAAIQEKIQRLQALGNQLQATGQQRQQMEMMHSETERATKALEDLADDAAVYRSAGSLLVRDSKADAVARLTEELETLEIRVKRMRSQEEELAKQFEAVQKEVQKALQA